MFFVILASKEGFIPKGTCNEILFKSFYFQNGINLNFAEELESMNEDFEWLSDKDVAELIGHFEELMESGDGHFFDVEEFEAIIDYYLDRHKKGMSKAAIALAKEQHPSCNSFKIREVRLLSMESKYEKALRILDELELLEPGNEDILLTRGEIYGMMDRHQEAIEAYKKVLENESDRIPEVLFNIAYEYESLDDVVNSIKYLRKALETQPYSEEVIQDISFFFDTMGREEEAVEFYISFLEKFPYSKHAWFHLGYFYSMLDLYERAVESYEFATAIDESYTAAYLNMANAFSNMGQYKKAIKFYKETFKLEDPDPLTYCYIGECYENLGDFSEALKNFNRAIDLDKAIVDAWSGIARVLVQQGKIKTAIKYYQDAIKIFPREENLKYELGALYLQTNDLKKAAEAFQPILKHNPNHIEAWMNYSLIYALDSNFTEAIQILEDAIKSNSDEATLWYRLAGYMYRAGRIEDSFFHIEQAFKLDFEKHSELLEYLPELIDEPRFIELIEIYKETND